MFFILWNSSVGERVQGAGSGLMRWRVRGWGRGSVGLPKINRLSCPHLGQSHGSTRLKLQWTLGNHLHDDGNYCARNGMESGWRWRRREGPGGVDP